VTVGIPVPPATASTSIAAPKSSVVVTIIIPVTDTPSFVDVTVSPAVTSTPASGFVNITVPLGVTTKPTTTVISTGVTVVAQSTVTLPPLVARDHAARDADNKKAKECSGSMSIPFSKIGVTETWVEEVPCAPATRWSRRGNPNPMNPFTEPELATMVPADVRSLLSEMFDDPTPTAPAVAPPKAVVADAATTDQSWPTEGLDAASSLSDASATTADQLPPRPLALK
jgi:hypothetical protein